MRPAPCDPQLTARIPSPLHRAIKLAAFREGVSLRNWVADALETHLREVAVTDGDENAPKTP
jgi:predicted HicB family RNase H-like nuclease